MKIGFDVSQTGRSKAGCGFYADGLIGALAASPGPHEYILYPAFGDLFWDPECATATFRTSQPRFRSLPAPPNFEESQRFWRHPAADFETRLGSPDIVHSNNFYCPGGLTRARLIYTLYDLSFMEEPSWTTEANRVGCFHGMFQASLTADWIVAISDYSRRHFLATFPHYPAARIALIYPASRFTAASAPPPCPARFAHLPPAGFWLSVGTIEPRKNHRRLLEAYRMTNPSMPLVLAGGKGWLMDEFAADDVLLTGYVTDEELAWLYRNCFAFLYPSLFEGFGMPVLEALTLGAPVICSNNTSLPEVAGDAALLVDPLDVSAIAAAMQRLASGEVSREALKQKGEIQSRRFSWHQSAARLRDLYEQVAQSPPHLPQPRG